MSEELRLSGYREPLGLWVRPRLAERPDLRAEEIEFSSRGDRVSGRVLLPAAGGGPFPLVLLQHGRGGSARDPALEATGATWAGRGAAVASIDLPLHGRRADQKLLGFLPGGPTEAPGPLRDALAVEFARQAVIDLERTLDALTALEWIDDERIAFVGFGLGAVVGSAFCALDPRPRAGVLALPEPLVGPEAIDPARYLGRIAPRPLLFVGTEGDRRATGGWISAAGEPKQQRWLDAPDDERPGAAERAIWPFLTASLGLT